MVYGIYDIDNIFTMLLIAGGFGIVLYAQLKINNAYQKYKQRKNSKNISGCEVARKILDENGLKQIYVVETSGILSDHYDPDRKVIRLSSDIFHGTSIAALSVAAHECGHAIQDKENYKFMRIRATLVPFVNFVSYIGYFSLLISLIGGITGYIKVSILILLSTVLFQLVTLPVEFDASKRAKEQIDKLKLEKEKEEVNEMLQAAAFTYVAALISTLLNLFRLILILMRNDDR